MKLCVYYMTHLVYIGWHLCTTFPNSCILALLCICACISLLALEIIISINDPESTSSGEPDTETCTKRNKKGKKKKNKTLLLSNKTLSTLIRALRTHLHPLVPPTSEILSKKFSSEKKNVNSLDNSTHYIFHK